MGYAPAMEELMEERAFLAPPGSQAELATPVRIYTDGSILVNPGGHGGWAFVAAEGEEVIEIRSGAVRVSTNNRMELAAVIEAMRWASFTAENGGLRKPVEIVSDSQYVVKGLNEYMAGWIARDWRKVKNPDLWRIMRDEFDDEIMSLTWVKGHAGNRLNELADELCGDAARRLRDA
jgi:ribonuclease HI